MFDVTSLGSGSSGNALLVRTAGAVLLIDCGVGVRRLSRTLGSLGLDLSDVDAVLLSHEHSDHSKELPRFSSPHQTVVTTKGSARAMKLSTSSWEEIRTDRSVRIADAEIFAIPVDHDAAEPCGFLVCTPEGSVTVLTDIGRPCLAAAEAIAESRLVVLEANHDEIMLRRGPYPAHLQRRILSDTGHLSNAGCGELLARALCGLSFCSTVWLAHLSETNNRPHLAKQTVQRRLAQAGIQLEIHALPRKEVNQTWRPDIANAGVGQLAFDLPMSGGDPWSRDDSTL